MKIKMSNEEYHKHEALGSTNLKNILKSPAHYVWEKENPTEPTPAMKFGTLFHEAALEPEYFENTYRVMPEFSGRGSTALKEEWIARQSLANKKPIDEEDLKKIMAMKASINKSKNASRLLDCGKAEESYFSEINGVLCKAKPDLLRDGKIIVDIKTTTDAGLGDFQKTIANFKYHLSAALYLDVVSRSLGEKYDEFILIAVEKTPPFELAMFLLDEATIDAGRYLYKKALGIYGVCQVLGKWPGYPDAIQPINLPSWAWPSEI